MRRLAFTGLVAAFIALTTISCNKTEKFTPISEKATTTINSTTNTSRTVTVDLITAKNDIVGTVKVVGEDADTFFVTYTTTNGWMLECIHLYVGSRDGVPTNGTGNPQIGRFPTHECFNTPVDSATYEITLSDPGDCVIIAAQAEVSSTNVEGIFAAWTEGTSFAGQGNWATYIDYFCPDGSGTAITTDETEQTCTEENAVAWADGITFGSGPNCFSTYVSYNDLAGDSTNIITSLNGQTAGTVHFSEIDENNKVTITIDLADNWILNPDIKCSVKIEGYDLEPTTKPKPYEFTTYKGSDLEVTVPYYPFYAVHLNLTLKCE